VSVKLASLSLFEQRFVTTLRIQNPSNAELGLEGISIEIEFYGNTFGRGVRPGARVIPAYGQDTVGVETISTTSGIVRHLRALARTGDGTLNYRLTGRLQPPGSARRHRLRRRGSFPSAIWARDGSWIRSGAFLVLTLLTTADPAKPSEDARW
jgi:LEA14-like dessication related protein